MTLIKQPTPENILLAAKNLKDGALIGLPTETVYGLAADAENKDAVRRIYEVKGRPFDHPLIVHIGSIEYLEKWAVEIPNFARELVDNFWPGPMTVILKRSKIAKDFVTGGQETVAVRIPKNDVALEVLQIFHELGGNGLAAPSANLFGAVSPTLADDVIEDLGKSFDANLDFVLDGGKCEIGIESTIINCTSKFPTILRKGQIQEIDITNLSIKIESENSKNQKIKFSGNMKKHYSPKAIVVNEGPIRNGDGYIAMRNFPTPKNCIRLAAPKDIQEFGQQLYSAFRLGDKLGLQRIYIVSPRNNDFGAAIQDRIERASNAFNV